MLLSMLAALSLTASSTPAAPAGLREVILFGACKRAGYTVYADARNATRLLERIRTAPDTSTRVTQRYDARGRLTTVQASATGSAGVRYDITLQMNSRGQVVTERGYRAPGERPNVRALVADERAIRAGRCS